MSIRRKTYHLLIAYYTYPYRCRTNGWGADAILPPGVPVYPGQSSRRFADSLAPQFGP